ncbi:MAG TPA: hypothetical protein VF897_09545, partial [Roseiflexaceae bacterium]
MRTIPNRRRWLPALLLVVLLAACDTLSPPGQGTGSPGAASQTTAASQTAPAPQPTALPAPDLLARALRAREYGDYDAAALDLRALLDA